MPTDEAKLIVKFEAENKKLYQQLDRTTKRLDRFEKSAKKNALGVSSAFKGLAVGATLAFATRGIVRYTDEYTNLSNRLKLATRSSNEFVSAQNAVYDIAQSTRQSYSATAELYQRLALSTRELGFSQEDLGEMVATVNRSLVISGSTAQAAEAAIIQLGQGLAAGALRGQEFNSVAEQAPRLMQALADSLGVGIGRLRDMANNGELTAKVVTDALRNQSDVIAKEFAGMSTTVQQAMLRIDNAMIKALGSSNYEATRDLTGALNDFADLVSDPKIVAGLSNISGALVTTTAYLVRWAAATANWAADLGVGFKHAAKGASDAEGAIKDLARMRDLGANLSNPGMSERFARNERALDFFIGAADVDRVKLYSSQIETEIKATLTKIGTAQEAGKTGEIFEPYLQALVAAKSKAEQALAAKNKLLAGGPSPDASVSLKNNVETPYSEDLQKAFDKTLASLQQQISMYGQVGEAAKLRYEIENGALAKLNEADKQRLLGLAQQFDALNNDPLKEKLEEFNAALSSAKGPQESFNQQVSAADQLLAAEKISLSEYNTVLADYKANLADALPGIQSADELHAALTETLSSEERQVQTLESRIGELTAAMGEFPDQSTEIAGAIQNMRAEQAKLIEDMEKQNDQLSVFADEASRNIQDALGDTLTSTLKGDFDNIGQLWGDMLTRMAAEAAAIHIADYFEFDELFKSGAGKGGGGSDSGDSGGGFLSSVAGFFGGFFADGGALPAGKMSFVGEKGIEAVIPPGPGYQVMPNHELSGGGNISVGQMIFPGVTNEREAKLAAGAAGRELAKAVRGAGRYR